MKPPVDEELERLQVRARDAEDTAIAAEKRAESTFLKSPEWIEAKQLRAVSDNAWQDVSARIIALSPSGQPR
jgi:hypothetical protein